MGAPPAVGRLLNVQELLHAHGNQAHTIESRTKVLCEGTKLGLGLTIEVRGATVSHRGA